MKNSKYVLQGAAETSQKRCREYPSNPGEGSSKIKSVEEEEDKTSCSQM